MDLMRLLGNATLAYAEKDLPGGYGNLYSLGGSFRQRLLAPALDVREAWAQGCHESTGLAWFSPDDSAFFPLLHLEHNGGVGALTAQLKGCYGDASPTRARVALDIDGLDNTKPFPSAEALFLACAQMMQQHTNFATDWTAEPAVVFMLSMPGKERSAHVYFTNVCFSSDVENVLGKAHALTATFNQLLEPLGMQGDFSICNSGLRWAFGNKFPPNKSNGRDRVAVPTFFNLPTTWSWKDLSNTIDPHVLPSDPAFQRQVSWLIPADNRSRKKHAAAAPTAVAPALTVNANLQPTERALIARLPEYIDCVMKRVPQPGGVMKLLPLSTYCPFKVAATDDNPPYHHGSPKVYAFSYPNGSTSVFCGVCEGKRMYIDNPNPGDDVIEARVLEEFNGEWARLGASTIMRYPRLLADGAWVPLEVLNPAAFWNAASNLNPTIKVGKRNFTECQFWYSHPGSTRYPYGTTFNPSFTHDSNFYNTYRGFNPHVLAKVDTVGIDEWQHTRELIEQNICGGDAAVCEAVIGFFVDLVQNPGRKPGWGICMFGPQGCGKGLTTQFFAKVIGRAHTCVLDATALEGQYNSRMMESLLVVAEEAVAAKEEKTVNMLKAYVTESTLPVRQKYRDEKEAETFMRIVMLSNSDAPVVIEDRDRRWLVLNASYRLGDDQDAAWRSKIADIVEERESLRGAASFYKFALQHDNSGFDPRLPIRTKARWQVRYERFNDYERYFYRMLCTGTVCANVGLDADGCYAQLAKTYSCDVSNLGEKAWTFRVPKRVVYLGLLETSRNDKMTEAALWKFIHSVMPESAWKNERPNLGAYRCRTIRFPLRSELKAAFASKLGQPMSIYAEWKFSE